MEKTTRRLRKAQATIGLDLGDKRHTFCVLDTRGEIMNKGSMRNERNELAKLASAYPGALVVMEAGMHSPWISLVVAEKVSGASKQAGLRVEKVRR
jgi:hypothetical protein